MTRPGAPRLQALTGIRIAAALAVYANHVGPPQGLPHFAETFFVSGYCGVTLFFVLSGFVLAINYFDGFRRPSATGLYNYCVARFARIYPLYLLILFYFVVRQHALGVGIDGWWRNALAIQAWDPNLEQAFAFDPPSWSISVEFFLYACFPLLVPLIARLRRPRSLLVAAGATAAAMAVLAGWFVFNGHGTFPWDASSAHRWIYRMPLTRLGDFILGILAARLFLETKDRPSIVRWGAPLAVGAGVAVVCLMCWPGLLLTPWSWDLAYAIPAAVFVFGLAIAPLSRPARLFSLPFVVLLGEASYAFYLIHQPAIGYLGGGQWATLTSMTSITFEALTLGAILAMAVGLHVTIERPARVYIRRVLFRRRDPRPVPSDVAGELATS